MRDGLDESDGEVIVCVSLYLCLRLKLIGRPANTILYA